MQTSCSAPKCRNKAAWSGRSHCSSKRGHDDLRQGHDHACEFCRICLAKLHRQRTDAHLLVAFDGLEIIQRHDAMGTNAVEQGEIDDFIGGRAASMAAAAVNHGSPS